MTTIRPARAADAAAAAALVAREYDAFIDPGHHDPGTGRVLAFASAQRIAQRVRSDGIGVVAEGPGGQLLGYCEIQRLRHLLLLFVRRELHRRGIARALLTDAIRVLQARAPNRALLTVNSTLWAVPAYRRLGFVETGPDHVEDGIAHQPMVLDLSQWAEPCGQSPSANQRISR